jgi:glycosyltransferase involved in cell wall biosynthesis
MSLGIPIVATNVGGIPEVIENSKAGLLSNKDDINSFAQNILSILNSNKLAEYLSKNGKIYYNKNFTASKMSTQYHNLINNE